MEINEQALLETLSRYPSSLRCFSSYVKWVCENVSKDLEKYELIVILDRNDQGELAKLEEQINASCRILDLKVDAFASAFGFLDDLLVDDAEKVHDLLNEARVTIYLDKQGFTHIQKLPPRIKKDGRELACADFLATRKSRKYAVEVKTIRMENDLEDGVVYDGSGESNWWCKMFFCNAVTKIEDKSQRAIRQLESTKEHYTCDYKMLAIVSRRLGPSALLSECELLAELSRLRSHYPQIDYFLQSSTLEILLSTLAWSDISARHQA